MCTHRSRTFTEPWAVGGFSPCLASSCKWGSDFGAHGYRRHAPHRAHLALKLMQLFAVWLYGSTLQDRIWFFSSLDGQMNNTMCAGIYRSWLATATSFPWSFHVFFSPGSPVCSCLFYHHLPLHSGNVFLLRPCEHQHWLHHGFEWFSSLLPHHS